MRALATFTCLTLAPVGLGILFDSVPMQWVGFVMTLLLTLAFGRDETDRLTFNTIEEAQAYLATLKEKRDGV